jgi:hypothetical protein
MSEDRTKETGNYEIDGSSKGRMEKQADLEPTT